jgi:cytochrome b
MADTFAPLVVLRLAGALLASRMQGKNLVAAMLRGRKRAAGPGDVP